MRDSTSSDPVLNVSRDLFVGSQGREGNPLDAYGDQTSKGHYNNGSTWDVDRKIIHLEVLEELQELYWDVPAEGKAVFIGGEPGVGKSTLRSNVTGLSDGYAVSDPDLVREILIRKLVDRGLIPSDNAMIEDGLKPMELAGVFHQEAQAINFMFEEWALAERKNIIFDTSMLGESSLARNLDVAALNGYSTTGIYLQCDEAVAMERRHARFMQESRDIDGLGGRAVPPDFCADVRNNAPTVFENLRNRENGFDHSILADVSGDSPKFIQAWEGQQVARDISGLHQINLSTSSSNIFVPDGVEGYEPQVFSPQYHEFKSPVDQFEVDSHIGDASPNEPTVADFSKVQTTLPDGIEQGGEVYDVTLDYGDESGIGIYDALSNGPTSKIDFGNVEQQDAHLDDKEITLQDRPEINIPENVPREPNAFIDLESNPENFSVEVDQQLPFSPDVEPTPAGIDTLMASDASSQIDETTIKSGIDEIPVGSEDQSPVVEREAIIDDFSFGGEAMMPPNEGASDAKVESGLSFKEPGVLANVSTSDYLDVQTVDAEIGPEVYVPEQPDVLPNPTINDFVNATPNEPDVEVDSFFSLANTNDDASQSYSDVGSTFEPVVSDPNVDSSNIVETELNVFADPSIDTYVSPPVANVPTDQPAVDITPPPVQPNPVTSPTVTI